MRTARLPSLILPLVLASCCWSQAQRPLLRPLSELQPRTASASSKTPGTRLRPLGEIQPRTASASSQPRLRPLRELLEKPTPAPAPQATLGKAAVPKVYDILDTAHCPPALRAGFPVLTPSGPGSSVFFDTLRARHVVEKAYQTLQATHDLVLLGGPGGLLPHQVCVGLYDDGDRPNAVALGQATILFGSSLFRKLERMPARSELLSMVVLHEFAHSLQNFHGEDYSVGQGGQVLQLVSTRRKELVADCLAGALFARQHPPLLSMTANQALADLFTYLGDAHAVGNHGMSCQRSLAFTHGQELARQPSRTGFEHRSGPLLASCRSFVDQPEVLYRKCP